jgi:hypothetical protein
MKKLISLLAVVLVAISLSACQSSGSGSDASKAPTSSVASSAPTKEAPVSLNGSWKAEGLEAVVDADGIEISIVSADSTSLYWKGTFVTGTDKITSIGDREALDGSMLGSQDSDKVFNIDGDQITFKMSMMGTTKTIKLQRA